MKPLNMYKSKRKNPKGFTLIELIVTIAIISILLAVAFPKFAGYTKNAEKEVCKMNCRQMEKMYQIYLIEGDIEHSDEVFNQFLTGYGDDLCPGGGEMTYFEGEIRCSVHSEGSGEEESDDGEDGGSVPFL